MNRELIGDTYHEVDDRGIVSPSTQYQPKTGQPCHCKQGVQRDNCPACEGTGWRIDFAAIRAHALDGSDDAIEARIVALRTELSAYHALHDGLSDMIESGRLTIDDIPDDYNWLVESLANMTDASLPAAAPDLLAAARRGIAALAANGAPNCEAAKELRAAIARAERTA